MSALIVSISGIRGIVGESLGPGQALEFGQAFGSFLKAQKPQQTPKVCIGRDSRPSGPMLAAALSAGLMATGCQTVDLGIVTTPGTALMTRHLSCDGGAVITASHNPVQWNGIKFFRSAGIAFPAEQAQQIQAVYQGKQFIHQDALGVAAGETNAQAHALHADRVLQLGDKKLIASKRFKVVLDSINGAGCVVTADLLGQLGCELVHLNNRATGLFAHKPEPTAENLAELGPQILKHGAAIGFAQDPDADRLAVIDEKGNYIGEEYTLALAARYVFSKKTGSAATNLSTSRMIDDLAAAAGGSVIRTPVGEAHVANAMIENNCIIGGEGNGGVIDLRVGPVRDSLVGMVLILQLLAETGRTVSELVAGIRAYHMVKTKFPCPLEKAQATLDKVRSRYEQLAGDPHQASIDVRDGVRIDLPDGWVHVRASNTEPIIRIFAESTDRQLAEKLIKQVRNLAEI